MISLLTSALTAPIGSRWHLIEFHEQPYCPDIVRTHVVDTLEIMWTQLPTPATSQAVAISTKLARMVKQNDVSVVVDVCSGAGGPMPFVMHGLQQLRDPPLEGGGGDEKEAPAPVLRLFLTDLFPQPGLWRSHTLRNANVVGWPESIDASRMSPAFMAHASNGGVQRPLRTVVGSFHHFTPELAAKVLQNAIDSHHPVLIVETTERSLHALVFLLLFVLPFAFLLPIVLLLKWAIGLDRHRTFRSIVERAVLTYVFPIVPFMLWIDGLTSCLRTYSRKEFEQVVRRCNGWENFDWEVQRTGGPLGLVPLTCYTGVPRAAATAAAS